MRFAVELERHRHTQQQQQQCLMHSSWCCFRQNTVSVRQWKLFLMSLIALEINGQNGQAGFAHTGWLCPDQGFAERRPNHSENKLAKPMIPVRLIRLTVFPIMLNLF
jgi:hypothetical protein